MEIQKTLAFSEEEFRGRVARVQDSMAAAGLDGLVVHSPENICYLAGYHTAGYYYVQAVLVPPAGDPFIVTRGLETANVTAHSWFAPEATFGYLDTEDPVDAIVGAMRELGIGTGRLGVEQSGFSFLPIASFHALSAAFPNAEVVNGSGLVEKERMIKSPAEIGYIRQAAAISGVGIQASVDHCRAGVTENLVAGEIYKAMVEKGGEYAGLPVFLNSGHRTLAAHATPTDKVIEQGETVFVELTGVVKRYAGPLFRTLSVGKPDATLAHNAAILADMLNAVIDAFRPGATAEEVDAASSRVAAEAGLGSGVRKRVGYSVGLNFPPDWGEGYFLDLKPGATTELRPGMVFHVPPTMRLAGEAPIAISETVLITEDGREVLTDYPRELIVV